MAEKYVVDEWHNPLYVKPEYTHKGIGRVSVFDNGNSIDTVLDFEDEESHGKRFHDIVVVARDHYRDSLTEDQQEAVKSAIKKEFSLVTFIETPEEYEQMIGGTPPNQK